MWIDYDYVSQIQKKETRLHDSFSAFQEAVQKAVRFDPPVLSQEQGFRNRAKMSVTGTLENPIIGLIGEDDLDQGRELLSCPIHHPKLNALIESMPEWITKARLEPYRIAEKKGELKSLILYHSPESDQSYLRLVLRSTESISRLPKYLPELQAQFPNLVCISANIQPIPHAILEGEEEIFLTSRHWIDHNIGEQKLRLTPQAFVQTNFEVAKKLYETAAKWVGESHASKMLDLYCGQGVFSFFAAPHVKEVLGIELNREAVAMATETARASGFDHLRFVAADAGSVEVLARAFSPDLVVVNPPRRGLGAAAEWIHRLGAKHLIYSSCSVESLSKDLKYFTGNYRLKRVQLFDMFPHTEHFETLVWMEKRE